MDNVKFYISKADSNVRKLYIETVYPMECNWIFLEGCPKLADLSLDRLDGDMDSLHRISRRLPSLKRLNIVGVFDMVTPVQFLQNSLNLEFASFHFLAETSSPCQSTGMISSKLKSLAFEGPAIGLRWLRFPVSHALQGIGIKVDLL